MCLSVHAHFRDFKHCLVINVAVFYGNLENFTESLRFKGLLAFRKDFFYNQEHLLQFKMVRRFLVLFFEHLFKIFSIFCHNFYNFVIFIWISQVFLKLYLLIQILDAKEELPISLDFLFIKLAESIMVTTETIMIIKSKIVFLWAFEVIFSHFRRFLLNKIQNILIKC